MPKKKVFELNWTKECWKASTIFDKMMNRFFKVDGSSMLWLVMLYPRRQLWLLVSYSKFCLTKSCCGFWISSGFGLPFLSSLIEEIKKKNQLLTWQTVSLLGRLILSSSVRRDSMCSYLAVDLRGPGFLSFSHTVLDKKEEEIIQRREWTDCVLLCLRNFIS